MGVHPNAALVRVVKILECFSHEPRELGVREVARRTGLSSSATGRLMLSMKELGILSQNPITKDYFLGSRLLTWAGAFLANCDIRNVAYPYLLELHARTRETISLYILDGKERVCIERLESTHNVRFVAPRVGRHLPLHAGSAGKVLLAFLPDQRREAILQNEPLESLTEKTLVDPDKIRDEIEKIREMGYAISHGEWILEASGVAAPVFSQDGEVVAAVTISGPTQRFSDDKMREYAQLLMEITDRISRDLGYQRSLIR